MTLHPPVAGAAHDGQRPPADLLEKIVRAFSVVTLAMTVPQVYAVWFEREIGSVSLWSWTTYLLSALLWFAYGLRKRDKTIYVACIAWIALDAAIVVGVLVRGG